MRKSPFDIVHQQLGANFSSYDGWQMPSDYGDPPLEVQALTESCAVLDLCSFGRIQVNGKNAKETINKVISTEKGTILTERWKWAKTTDSNHDFLCRVFRLNGNYIILTKPSQTNDFIQMLSVVSNDDTAIIDLTDKTAMLGLYGPKAFESIQGVLPFDISHLDVNDAERMSFMMMSFTILRGSWLNGDGLELICPVAAGPLIAGAVAKYRHKHNITPAGMDTLICAMQQANQPI